MTTAEEEKPVSLVAKATAVLDALGERSVMSTAEIAATIGEPPSSVYRLLDALTRIDWIEPAASRGKHRLSPRWMGYGTAISRGIDLRRIALPVLQQLRETTGETAFLCVRRGDRAACIERVDGEGVQSLALAIGGSLPLHVGAAPQVLLAAATPGQIEDYIKAIPSDSQGGVRERIAKIVDRGYAVSDGDVTTGIGAIGAPVKDHSGRVVAAISLSGLRESLFDAERAALPTLLTGARVLSASLGYSEVPE